MIQLINGAYYRVQIEAEDNTEYSLNMGEKIDRIFLLTNARFVLTGGCGFTLYEATLMKTKISISSKNDFDKQESERFKLKNASL